VQSRTKTDIKKGNSTMANEPINPINPNEEATPDPRIETQRQRQSQDPTILTYEDDETLPVDSDHQGLVLPPELREPNELEDEENPTGDDHFYEMAPTSTSGAEAMQEIDEDFEELEEAEEGRR
jgi:hypothetical protein